VPGLIEQISRWLDLLMRGIDVPLDIGDADRRATKAS
jgi:hypothetical protein